MAFNGMCYLNMVIYLFIGNIKDCVINNNKGIAIYRLFIPV